MTGITPEPNYYGRQLQRELRRLRELNRLTQEEAGERVHIEFKKLSRIERRQLPTYHELIMLLDAYGVVSCDYGPYVQLWELAKQKAWWREFQLEETRYIRMEDEADVKYEFQLGHIPTLLQTREYARSTITAAGFPDAGKLVEVRMRQQERLDTDPTIRLHALIHEPVLHQGIDRTQRDVLVKRAELANVTVQIVPQRYMHDGLQGSVVLLSFDDPNEPDAAFTETLIGLQETQEPDQTGFIRRTLDHIRDIAESPEATLDMLRSLRC